MLGGIFLKSSAGFWKIRASMTELSASNSVLTGSTSEVRDVDS